MFDYLPKLAFSLRVYQLPDGFISRPYPKKSVLSGLLAGLRDYSPIASLLDSRLLQLKECLSLIRLNRYSTGF